MPTVDVTTQYLVIVTATFLFSVLAILETEGNAKKLVLQWIAAVAWFVSGYIHFLSGDITNIFTTAPTYLFIGIGIIFVLNALYTVFQLATEKSES